MKELTTPKIKSILKKTIYTFCICCTIIYLFTVFMFRQFGNWNIPVTSFFTILESSTYKHYKKEGNEDIDYKKFTKSKVDIFTYFDNTMHKQTYLYYLDKNGIRLQDITNRNNQNYIIYKTFLDPFVNAQY